MKKDYSNQYGHKLIVKEKGKFNQIEICKILVICCKGYLSTIKTDDSEITVSHLLKEYEEELVEYGFVRINRNNLVNLNHIKSFFRKNNKPTIIMSNNEQLIVSRRNLHKLLELLKN